MPEKINLFKLGSLNGKNKGWESIGFVGRTPILIFMLSWRATSYSFIVKIIVIIDVNRYAIVLKLVNCNASI